MHCMVQLDSIHVVSTGGRGTSSNSLASAEILNLALAMTWSRLADMKMSRFGHACGLYGGDSATIREIVVVGGMNVEEAEVLSADSFAEWQVSDMCTGWARNNATSIFY